MIWFSSIIAALSLYIYEKNPSKSLKKLMVEFLQMFKSNKKLKNKYFIFLYFAFVAFMTLFNRKPYLNPLNNIFGGWNLFFSNGQFNADAVENVILFIPMGSILTFYARSMSIKKWSYVLSRCIMISLGIETIQLFLFLGIRWNYWRNNIFVFYSSTDTLGSGKRKIASTLTFCVYGKIKGC